MNRPLVWSIIAFMLFAVAIGCWLWSEYIQEKEDKIMEINRKKRWRIKEGFLLDTRKQKTNEISWATGDEISFYEKPKAEKIKNND